MSHADRISDDIERVATGDFASILDELGKLTENMHRVGDAQSRLLMEHNGELAKLWDEIAALRDEHHDNLSALSNRLQAFGDAAAMRTELADLRAEVAEATATPFNPPEARHGS